LRVVLCFMRHAAVVVVALCIMHAATAEPASCRCCRT
jgi:hypothetical protein